MEEGTTPRTEENTINQEQQDQRRDQQSKDEKASKIDEIINWVFWVLMAALIIGFIFGIYYIKSDPCNEGIGQVQEEKPVIYLYPEEQTEVTVELNLKGELTCTYPKYNADTGWIVTANPDGTLTDAAGKQYNYLYWEGITNAEYSFDEGFCISGTDTALFLEEALYKLGLTYSEANEFIVYWLPRMEQNTYNLISFQTEEYTNNAELNINPTPDTIIRVFMTFKPLTEYVDIESQILESPERVGFTVVEWGGAEIS